MSIAHAAMVTISPLMSLIAWEWCENYCQIQLGSFLSTQQVLSVAIIGYSLN